MLLSLICLQTHFLYLSFSFILISSSFNIVNIYCTNSMLSPFLLPSLYLSSFVSFKNILQICSIQSISTSGLVSISACCASAAKIPVGFPGKGFSLLIVYLQTAVNSLTRFFSKDYLLLTYLKGTIPGRRSSKERGEREIFHPWFTSLMPFLGPPCG